MPDSHDVPRMQLVRLGPIFDLGALKFALCDRRARTSCCGAANVSGERPGRQGRTLPRSPTG